MSPRNRETLRHVVPLRLDGFHPGGEPYGGLSFHSAVDLPAQAQFDAFRDRVLGAMGRTYLPVYRMADGEFALMVGWRRFTAEGSSWARRAWHKARERLNRFGLAGNTTVWGEKYAGSQAAAARSRLVEALRFIAARGILAAYLVERADGWGDQYLLPVMDWLDEQGIPLSAENYVPFYFAYALLRGPGRHALFRDRRVLVATSLGGGRRERIEEGLRREGVREVRFLEISASNSMFDVVDTTPHQGECDLALVAAGIGSANVLERMEPLGVPCIDAGIVVECLMDPSRRDERPFLRGSDET